MSEHKFRDSYLSANLTFEDDKITWHCPEMNDTREVMMSWEQPIMSKMAEVAVEAGDDVLECGFGMGILSTAVQSRNPASHTIVECHPQILVKAREWAADKPNVTIIEGKWWDLMSDHATRYTAILMDTYVDDDLHSKFRYFCKNKGVDGCKISWWNFSGGTTDEWMKFYWEDVTFTEVTGLNPPENTYYNRDNYFIPLKILQRPQVQAVAHDSYINYRLSTRGPICNLDYKMLGIMTEEDHLNWWPKLHKATTKQDMKAQGVFNITFDVGDLKCSANLELFVRDKENNTWVAKKVKDLVVGDSVKANTKPGQKKVKTIEFDNSDTVHRLIQLGIDRHYYINDILTKKTL